MRRAAFKIDMRPFKKKYKSLACLNSTLVKSSHYTGKPYDGYAYSPRPKLLPEAQVEAAFNISRRRDMLGRS